MTNIGKFTDRSPIICPAGKVLASKNSTVATCMKEYNVEDEIDALKHDAKIFKQPPFTHKLPPLKDYRHKGAYTYIRPLLNPPVKTRFQTLVNDLKETSCSSFWNQPLGRCRDDIPGLPRGIDKLNTTFGKKTVRETTVKELINPPKTSYEVLSESQKGHDLYKKSHSDYNPSEQIKRNYLETAYNSNQRFGKRSKYDPRGIWVKCCSQWIHKEPTCVVNDIQADFIEKTRPKLGKCLTPNKNIEMVPEGHTFGDPSIRHCYGVEDLLKDKECTPDLVKRDLLEWIVSLNRLRNRLKKQNSFDFSFEKIFRKFLYYDRGETCCISLDAFYEVCSCYHITFNKEHIESLLKVLGIICNDQINYKKFLEVVNSQAAPTEFKKIEDIPERHKYYSTTYQAARCDYLFIDNSRLPVAGIPSVRNDLAYTKVSTGSCRANIDDLGEETNAHALLSRSIFTHYGLSHRDFMKPRSPCVIRDIIKKTGIELDDETFEKFWRMGVEHDKTGLVCIDTFYTLVKMFKKPPDIKIDEKEC